jgi:DNA-binding MarR family transcriptional regulator
LRPAASVTDLLYQVEQHRRVLLAEHLASRGLNFSQWIALRTLYQRGPCSMSELAQSTAIDRTSLTRTVDVLTGKGLAARWTPPRDRRSVLVDATPDGKWLAEAVEAEVEALEGRLLVDLSAKDHDLMARSLEKILARLPGRGGPADGAERAPDSLTRRSRSA